jgi:hypothetical protein
MANIAAILANSAAVFGEPRIVRGARGSVNSAGVEKFEKFIGAR